MVRGTRRTPTILWCALATLVALTWALPAEAGCNPCERIYLLTYDCNTAKKSSGGCVKAPGGCRSTTDSNCSSNGTAPGTDPEERGSIDFNRGSGQWQLASSQRSAVSQSPADVREPRGCGTVETFVIY